MSGGLISPLLWQLIPFEDVDAWSDFLGQHGQWHETLAKATGTAWQPLDIQIYGGPKDEQSRQKLSRAGLMANQQMHYAVADALTLPRGGDMVSYDLTNPDFYTGFLWVHALDHERLRVAAGL